MSHFLLRRHSLCQSGRMCSIVQLGRKVRSRIDYIIGTGHCLFRNVSVQEPRHNLYQYTISGCLHSDTLSEHTKCLGRHTRIPLQPLTTLMREDGIFADLRRAIPKPKAWEAQNNSWILAGMWWIVDTIVYTCQDPVQDQALIPHLSREINMNLKADRRRKTEKLGGEIDALVA